MFFVLGCFIIPSVALASWWNPFSWKVFRNKNHKVDTQQSALEKQVGELQSQVDILKKQKTVPVSSNNNTQKKKDDEILAYLTNCENLLNKYNAELFKYKEGYSAQLKQVEDGMAKSKEIGKQKLANAYGNPTLWNSVLAEVDADASDWGNILTMTISYWDSEKAKIDQIPICAE